jgi:hypothetical protein
MAATMIGAKGSDVYSAKLFQGVEDKMVALSALLTRGVSQDTVYTLLDQIFLNTLNQKQVEDLLVLAFQTRDIRGGKGERDASKHIFDFLLKEPFTRTLTLELLDLIPEYGCWQDIFKLDIQNISRIKQIVLKQFTRDEAAIEAYTAALANEEVGWGGEEPPKKPKVSLLAKWLPREGQPNVIEFAVALVPGPMLHGTRMKLYRKRVSAVNKFLQTVEVDMCAKHWDDIVPGSVPGRAVKKYVKAFLNEKGTTRKHERAPPKGTLRHPQDPVRMACRANFQEHFLKTAKGEVKAKGADTLFPHEVVKKAYTIIYEERRLERMGQRTHRDGDTDDECDQSETPDEAERNHLRGVWSAMVEAAKEGGGLGRSLAMCDFSGSMLTYTEGTPYWVSMAMGLLISEVTTEEFKNTFLTFDSNPQFHTLPHGDLITKLKSFDPKSMSQGTSTDFQKAMDLVLAQCKEKRVKPGQEPENLIVLTDMAWDQACGSSENSYYTGNKYRNVVKTDHWQTHVEMIREAFKRAGEDMWGEGQGLKMPTIVIWNIAASCQDFHATATTPGVVMLSGWSPSLFKVLQTKGAVGVTPAGALRIQLEDERYDLVRQRVQRFYTSAPITSAFRQVRCSCDTNAVGTPYCDYCMTSNRIAQIASY